MPLVSIITPAYNAAETIDRCIESVARQRLQDWEHIIVDDCSSDRTASITQASADRDTRVQLVRVNENGGAARSRNLGIARARGRYLAFLDADDVWLPGKLSVQIGWMSKQASEFTYGAYYVAKRGERRPHAIFTPPESISHEDLLYGCAIGCSTVMIDRERVDRPYMPDFQRGQDWALWLSLSREGLRMERFPGVHTIYTTGGVSLSSNKLSKLRDMIEVYRCVEGLTWVTSSVLAARHAFHVMSRKRLSLSPVPASDTSVHCLLEGGRGDEGAL